MTKEEAKCIIQDMLDDAEKYGDIDYDNLNDFISACKVAIKALSAETMGDLISREQAIAIATQEGAYDYISAQELAELPSAEPKQKIGKWFTNIKKGTITCQVCKEEISYYPSIGIRPIWEYCPYCGSYNGGEQDD